jgi:hypothetical protein
MGRFINQLRIAPLLGKHPVSVGADELFVSNPKSNSTAAVNEKDAAIAVSLARRTTSVLERIAGQLRTGERSAQRRPR